jgi:hypothetical protein
VYLALELQCLGLDGSDLGLELLDHGRLGVAGILQLSDLVAELLDLDRLLCLNLSLLEGSISVWSQFLDLASKTNEFGLGLVVGLFSLGQLVAKLLDLLIQCLDTSNTLVPIKIPELIEKEEKRKSDKKTPQPQ